jgi:pyruvate/2-oxoacid:ferredoxin oxidoreductase beta subunit
MVTVKDYADTIPIAWCPGCGNFAILQSVRKALVELQLEPHQVLFVSGIGQAPKLPHYTHGNVFNGLHGRTLPVATGAKLANHELVVIGIDGDGGAYGEGAGHLLAAMRRNIDITYLVHNNQVYGLTKGQASPTSDLGFVTKTTPSGAVQPLNPLALALASDITFLARGFAGDLLRQVSSTGASLWLIFSSPVFLSIIRTPSSGTGNGCIRWKTKFMTQAIGWSPLLRRWSGATGYPSELYTERKGRFTKSSFHS